ncbi:sphingosine-1-phosphate phosphatase [Mycena rebaudengoi]|nr:sphingosine-1-phosphate phosphatase [Mycena rebaudengoi]
MYTTRQLPAWRAAIRRQLVKSIRVESEIIAKMQEAIRTPWLDKYFVNTSALGSHTFFMAFLPILFFFGYDEMGRGLIIVICLGIYITSVAKDLICAPRPFAPPVTRLTIGTHHLEYGMPSTHSTNCVSIALFFFGHLHELAFPVDFATPSLSLPTYVMLTVGLLWYATSIVFGRLYTAMHSFTDCITGVLLGAGIWLAHSSFRGFPVALSLALPFSPSASPLTLDFTLLRGLGLGSYLESWVLRTPSSLRVPFTLIPLALLAVNQHPQPVDDCPCFEDAIAIGSVVLGMLVGRWGCRPTATAPPASARGSPPRGRGRTSACGGAPRWLKTVFGICVIFVWRLLAKAALHRALPPTFRFLATRVTRLPHRRFYTPATQYTSVPPMGALRPIPSVLDLPTTGVEVGGIGSGSGAYNGIGDGKGGLRRRAEVVEAARGGDADEVDDGLGEGADAAGNVKHYDADVLTKVIVYAGIGVLACEGYAGAV